MAEFNNTCNSQNVVLQNHINHFNLKFFTDKEIEELPDAPTEPIQQHVNLTNENPVLNSILNSNKSEHFLPVPGALLPSASHTKLKKRRPSRRRIYSKPRKRMRKKKELFAENEISPFLNDIDSQDFESDASSDTIIMEDFDIPPVQNILSTNFTNNAPCPSVKLPELGKLLISNDMIKSDFPVKVKQELIESNTDLNSSNICSTTLNIKKEPIDYDIANVEPPALPEISDVFPVRNTHIPSFKTLHSDTKKYPDFCFKDARFIAAQKPKQTARKRTAPRNPVLIGNDLQKKNSSKYKNNSSFNEDLNLTIYNQQDFLNNEKIITSANNSSVAFSEKSEPIHCKKIVQSKNKVNTALSKQTKSEFLKSDTASVFPHLFKALCEQEKLAKTTQKKNTAVKKNTSPKKVNSKVAKLSEELFHNTQEEGLLVKDSDNQPVYLFPFENRLLSNKNNFKKSNSAKQLEEPGFKHVLEMNSNVENCEDQPPDMFSPESKFLATKKISKKSKNIKLLEEQVFKNVLEESFTDSYGEDLLAQTFSSEKTPLTNKTYKIAKNKKLSEEHRNALEEEFIVTGIENQLVCHSDEKSLPEIKHIKNGMPEKLKKASEENLYVGSSEDLMYPSPLVTTPLPKKKTSKRKAPLTKKKTSKISKNKNLSEELKNALEEEFIISDNVNQPSCSSKEKSHPAIEDFESVISNEIKNSSGQNLCVGSAEDLMYVSSPVNTPFLKKKTPKRKAPLTKKKTSKTSKNKNLSKELKNALDEVLVTDNVNQSVCSSEENSHPEIKNSSDQNVCLESTENLMYFSSVNTPFLKKKTPKRKAPLTKKKTSKISKNKNLPEELKNALDEELIVSGNVNQPSCSSIEESHPAVEDFESVVSNEIKNSSDQNPSIGNTKDLTYLSSPINTQFLKKKTRRRKAPLTRKKTSKTSKNKKLSEELKNTLDQELIVTGSENQPVCSSEVKPLPDSENMNKLNMLSEQSKNVSEEDLSVGSTEDLFYLSPHLNTSLPKKKKPKRSPRRFSSKKKKSHKKSDELNCSIQSISDIKDTEAIGIVLNEERSIQISEPNLIAIGTEDVLVADKIPALSTRKKVSKRRSPKKNSRLRKRKKSVSSKIEINNRNTENIILNEKSDFNENLKTTEIAQNNSANIHPALVSQSLLMKSGSPESLNFNIISLQNRAESINKAINFQNSKNKTNQSSMFLHNDRISLFNSSSSSILNLSIKNEPEDPVNKTNNIKNNFKENSSNVNVETNGEKNIVQSKAATIGDNTFKPYGNISIKTEVLSDDECSIIEVINASHEVNIRSTMSAESSMQPTDCSIKPSERPIKPTENLVKPTESSIKPTESSIKPVKSRKDPILSRLEDIAPNELLLGTRSETKRLRLLAATSSTGSENKASNVDSQNSVTEDKSNQMSLSVSNATSMSESSPYVTRKSKSKQITNTSQTLFSNEAVLQEFNKSKQISSTTSSPTPVSDASSSQISIQTKQISSAISSPAPVSNASLSQSSIQSKQITLTSLSPTAVFDASPSQTSVESTSEISYNFIRNPSVSIKIEVDSDEEDIPLSTLVSLKRKNSIESRVEEVTCKTNFGSSSKNINVFSSCPNTIMHSSPISNFPHTQESTKTPNNQADTLIPIITSVMNTDLHKLNVESITSASKYCMEKNTSKSKPTCSPNSQTISDITMPDCSISVTIPQQNLLSNSLESSNKRCEKQDFLISGIQIKKEKDVWPDEMEILNGNINKQISANILISDEHSSYQNCTSSSITNELPHSIGLIQQNNIVMNNEYVSRKECLQENVSLGDKTDNHQTLKTFGNSPCDLEQNFHLINNKTMNLNPIGNYRPITVNEMNKFESRISTSNRDSLISNFLSCIPSDLSTISERNLTSDNLMDSSLNFNNDLCGKSEDLDSSFSSRFSTPFNQDINNRAIDSASLWIGNENSSDSMQTHSSNVSFSYQNYDFSSTENLSNYEKNMKFFFKFPFPGDILSGFYKCRKKLKGKNYIRANPLPWNLSYEEVASRMRNATANGVDKGKDDSDINDLQYYSLIDEEIGCYHRLLGVAPSKKLISKCYKFDLKSISDQETQNNSALLPKSSSIDHCGISSLPSIFITDLNEAQSCKETESITELLNSTRKNVESLLPSEARHTFLSIQGTSKSAEQTLNTVKSFPVVFSDSSDSQSISSSCIPKFNNVFDNFSRDKNMSENLSVSQNISFLTPNALGLTNLSSVENTVKRTENVFCTNITSNEKAINQAIMNKSFISIDNFKKSSVTDCFPTVSYPEVSQMNLLTDDFQSNKISDPEILLEAAAGKVNNWEKLSTSVADTPAVTSSQLCTQSINSSEVSKTDILSKILQTIGLANFSPQKVSNVKNHLVPLQMNKQETECAPNLENTEISERIDCADSSKESKELKILADLPNTLDDSNGTGREYLNKPHSSLSNKESILEYVINNLKESQSSLIESSKLVLEKNTCDEITNSSNTKICESNIDGLKGNSSEEQGELHLDKDNNTIVTRSLEFSSLIEPDPICSSDENENFQKPQLSLNLLNSIVSLNTDDLKKILETAKNTNVGNDLTVENSNLNDIAIPRSDGQYPISDYDKLPNKNTDSISISSDYMYYDYHSPFLRIPTVRDYDHKSPLETVTNETSDCNVPENKLEKNISTKNLEEADSDLDQGVDNEFLPEYCDPNIDSEKEEENTSPKKENSSTEVQKPSTDNEKGKEEKEKIAITEESNKEMPQYKSRWERIMERKAIEKKKDEDLLLSYFHLSKSRRSNVSKKAEFQNPAKKTCNSEHRSKSQKKEISTASKSNTTNKDAVLPASSNDNSLSNFPAQKTIKVQKSVMSRQIEKTMTKKDLSPIKKTKLIGKKHCDTKISSDKFNSSHKKSKDDHQTNEVKLSKISPIKKKAKFNQLPSSDDSSSNLFTPDKVIKVINEKKIVNSCGKDGKDNKKIYGRVTNRGSFLTQSPLSDKPKMKTIQTKKSFSKPKDKSAFFDEIHSRIITPNIELTATTPTFPKRGYNYFNDHNYKDDTYSYNDYPIKQHSISNSEISISPIDDFSSLPTDTTPPVLGNSSSSNILPYIQSESSLPDPRLKTLHPVLPSISNNDISSFVGTTANIPSRRESDTTPTFQSSIVSSSTFNFDSLANKINSRESETTPVFQSSLVSSSTFNFDSLQNQSNDRLPIHNVSNKPKQRLSKCVCLPPRHMKDSVGHTVFDTINVLLLILEWNVDWLFQQRKNSSPPPISKSVKKVINTYEDFESYYNTYFPLLLLETWQRIYVSWNHLHSAHPYICEIKMYSVEQSSIKVECQTIFNPADTDRGLFPEEGNIIMVKFGTKSKGGIKTLGYVTEVKVRAVNPSIDSQSKCYQFWKCSPSDHLQLLQMSFIGAYTSEDFDIKLPIRVHVLCNVKINLKQNDALLKAKHSPLGKNILNPLEDELRVVELASRDSIDEEKIAFCVKEIVKGILSPHPIPIITIVKSYPSSDRLMILPPLIKRMKDSYGTKVLLCARTTKCLIDIGLYLDENHVKFVITGKRADVPLKLKKYLVEDLAVNRALSDQLSESSGLEDPVCKENLRQESVAKAKKFIFNDCDVILSLIKNCHDDYLGQSFADGDSVSQLCCIIDEANLCTEPEILIPVLFGISKLILIGNPDVSAKVCSKTASSYGYGKSLFHRAYELDLISE
ncbi:uncharacterized protein [Parasteatoda tepidariorum]|uniref:uncharacterized protein n=1 Tax=Parasteatoda tepidariorum TaxID=114398 RepID=UPI00077FAC4E|nr:uncharacterized protein LOC107444150 [Parasteatoda tepidariorum]XP_015913719.1 uncharacterized protein LOC107444150 [Parasteatoda tepidariorum]